jgi:hypothetical protein
MMRLSNVYVYHRVPPSSPPSTPIRKADDTDDSHEWHLLKPSFVPQTCVFGQHSRI